MSSLRRAALLLLISALALPAFAAAPPGDDAPKNDPPKPWQPYKEIPEVLYFESFEGEGPGIWNVGKVTDKTAPVTGGHSFKMGVHEEKDQSLQAVASFGPLGRFALMGGLKPADVKVQFLIWADNPGKVITHFGDEKTWYQQTMTINKIQGWTTLNMDLAEFVAGRTPVRDTTVFTRMMIVYQPQHAKASSAYIDDIAITHNARPADVLPRVLAIENKRAEVFRTPPRDGFAFNYLSQEALQNAVKSGRSRKRAKTVLVMTSRPEDAEAYKTALNAAQTKVRGSDYRFVFAEAPDGSPVAGLSDMRTLLQYNLQKSEAEMALLILGPADVAGGFPPGSEAVRVIQERALESGVVPIVCAMPPNNTTLAKDSTSLNRLYSAVITASRMNRTPWVDMGFAYKDNAAAIDKGNLSAAGIANLAEVAVKALRHVDMYVLGRK